MNWKMVIVMALALNPTACSTNPTGEAELPSVTKKITAQQGGVIETEGVSLNIPPGALAADTDVTIVVHDSSSYPDAANVNGNVYDFGPDGLTFTKPVEITLAMNGATAPEGKTAMIAFSDGAAWQVLADSAPGPGDKLVATTTHFTPFAIVWHGTGEVTTSACADLGATNCGGDITGLWEYTVGCVTLKNANSEPFPGCPTASVAMEFDLKGTADFGSDGTLTTKQTITTKTTLTIPKTCLPAGASCTDLLDDSGTSGGKTKETKETADACTQTESEAKPENTSTTPYSASGSTLTLDGGTAEYCVEGTTLRVKVDNDTTTVTYVAEKK